MIIKTIKKWRALHKFDALAATAEADNLLIHDVYVLRTGRVVGHNEITTQANLRQLHAQAVAKKYLAVYATHSMDTLTQAIGFLCNFVLNADDVTADLVLYESTKITPISNTDDTTIYDYVQKCATEKTIGVGISIEFVAGEPPFPRTIDGLNTYTIQELISAALTTRTATTHRLTKFAARLTVNHNSTATKKRGGNTMLLTKDQALALAAQLSAQAEGLADGDMIDADFSAFEAAPAEPATDKPAEEPAAEPAKPEEQSADPNTPPEAVPEPDPKDNAPDPSTPVTYGMIKDLLAAFAATKPAPITPPPTAKPVQFSIKPAAQQKPQFATFAAAVEDYMRTSGTKDYSRAYAALKQANPELYNTLKGDK